MNKIASVFINYCQIANSTTSRFTIQPRRLAHLVQGGQPTRPASHNCSGKVGAPPGGLAQDQAEEEDGLVIGDHEDEDGVVIMTS